jgi:hypothetical protein
VVLEKWITKITRGLTCNSYGDKKTFTQRFGGETSWKAAVIKTIRKWEDNIKNDLEQWWEVDKSDSLSVDLKYPGMAFVLAMLNVLILLTERYRVSYTNSSLLGPFFICRLLFRWSRYSSPLRNHKVNYRVYNSRSNPIHISENIYFIED